MYSETRARKIPSLDVYVKQAKASYDLNLSTYCKVVIRRPFGKLLVSIRRVCSRRKWNRKVSPLTILQEFFEGIENLLKTQAPEEISFNLSYSKTALKEVAKKYPGKEVKTRERVGWVDGWVDGQSARKSLTPLHLKVRKGLEALYRRVDKHFTEEEGSGQLLQVVWRGIQEEVVRQLRRYEELIAKCYKNFGVQLEFTVEEILMHFSEL